MRDAERGKMFLAEALRSSQSKDDWDLALSGVSNPHHAAYEIERWEKVGATKYRFYVWLYHHYTGEPNSKIEKGPAGIVEVDKEGQYYRVVKVPKL